jgi:hypothetical protein
MTKEAIKPVLDIEGPLHVVCKCPACKQNEPVTWRNAAIRVGEDLCSVGPFGYYDMTAKQWLDWALSVVTVHLPPQQRTWVGLTEQEQGAIMEDLNAHGTNLYPLTQAIEAKLKEKNS